MQGNEKIEKIYTYKIKQLKYIRMKQTKISKDIKNEIFVKANNQHEFFFKYLNDILLLLMLLVVMLL